MAETALSSILRLDADAWDYLSHFLVENALIRLLETGNKTLSARILTGARSICLGWKLAEYADCDIVFRTVSNFSRIDTIVFFSFCKQQLVLSPINWTILPQTIRRLELHFLGAIDSIFGIPHLNDHWPRLESLELHDTSQKHTDSWIKPVNFDSLPRGLISLTLKSRRRFMLKTKTLSDLPPHLETLCLDIDPNHVSDDFNTNPAEHFAMDEMGGIRDIPPLPASITSLLLKGTYGSRWKIRMGSLPRQLRSFTFKGTCRDIYKADSRYSSIDMEGVQDLTELREIEMEQTNVTLQTFLAVPSWVESVNWILVSSSSAQLGTNSLKKLITPQLLKSLTSFTIFAPRSRCNTLITSSSLNDLVNLRKLDIRHLGARSTLTADPTWRLPSSLTYLSCNDIHIDVVPPNLTLLKCSSIIFGEKMDLESSSPKMLPSSLIRLLMPEFDFMDENLIMALPSSLEELLSSFSLESWMLVYDKSRQGLLPKLKSVYTTKPFPAKGLAKIPKSLEKLMVWIGESSKADNLTDSEFFALSCCNLTALDIEFAHDVSERLFHGIMAHLPRSLTKLDLDTQLLPNIPRASNPEDLFSQTLGIYTYDPYTSFWPPQLKVVRVVHTPSDEPYRAKKKAFISSLPPTVQLLDWDCEEEFEDAQIETAETIITSECLPPYLSYFDLSTYFDKHDYYSKRQIPLRSGTPVRNQPLEFCSLSSTGPRF